MYVARYNLDGRELVQARVAVETSVPGHVKTILETLISTVQAVGLIGGAMRLSYVPGSKIKQSWAFTADSADERRLRRFVAGFLRIESSSKSHVDLPDGASEFDQLLGPLPSGQFRGVFNDLFRAGAFVACDLRLINELEQLLGEACVQQTQLVYQLQYAAQDIPPEMVREIRRNSLVLESTPGNSNNFVETQRIIASRSAESDHLLEEFIATPMTDWAWLSRRIAESVRKRGINLSGPVSCSANGFDELTTVGMHSSFFEPVLPPEWASCGVGSDLVREYLSWTPCGIVDELIDPGDDGLEDPGPPRLPPDPVPEGMVFDFVSYSRADTNRVQPVIQKAARAGVQLWWDRHIPGGVEWDEYLELQIQKCRVCILFLSNRAVSSKYVRREVKYADAIGKPILAIELEEVELKHGLAMLLTQYQRVRIDHPALFQAIRDMRSG